MLATTEMHHSTTWREVRVLESPASAAASRPAKLHASAHFPIIRAAKAYAFCLKKILAKTYIELSWNVNLCYEAISEVYTTIIYIWICRIFLQPTMTFTYRAVMNILVIHLLEWEDVPPLCFFSFSDSPFTKLLNLSLIQISHAGQTILGYENLFPRIYHSFAFIL